MRNVDPVTMPTFTKKGHEDSDERNLRASKTMTRRAFLKMGVITIVPLVSSGLGSPQAFALPEKKRVLSFYNTHTCETLDVVYWESGEYLSQPLSDINYILRDHRTAQVISIDRSLLDLLYAIRTKVRNQEPIHIISGYRSPATNAFLCERNSGVVENSLHVCGKAVDIRLPETDLSHLRQVAMDLKGGGVGFYPKSDFIHIDVGRVRYW